MCYPAVLSGSQNSCQLNLRHISIVCNNEYAISTILLLYYIYVFVFIYLYIYNCMFVSALPDPTLSQRNLRMVEINKCYAAVKTICMLYS